MKRSNAVLRLTFWLAVTFALVFSSQAQSGDRHIITTQQKHTSAHAIRIVDQNGRPVVNGVPSGGGQIFDVAVGTDGLVFTPDTVNISVGDTVRWTWGTGGHSVTSGDPCTADEQFCSPNNTNCGQCVTSSQGFVYEFTFTQAGSFSYFCCVHCNFGMTGVVNVAAGPTPTPNPTPTPTSTPNPTPTATPTAIPSATPSVTPPPTATPTATATVSPTPIGRPRPTPRARPTPHARP
jgi:plastocyanin